MTDHKTLRACLQRIGDEFDGLRAERASMTGPPDARQLFTDEMLRRASERWWNALAGIAVLEANDLGDLRILADTVPVLPTPVLCLPMTTQGGPDRWNCADWR
jgi:hypothetical protein